MKILLNCTRISNKLFLNLSGVLLRQDFDHQGDCHRNIQVMFQFPEKRIRFKLCSVSVSFIFNSQKLFVNLQLVLMEKCECLISSLFLFSTCLC